MRKLGWIVMASLLGTGYAEAAKAVAIVQGTSPTADVKGTITFEDTAAGVHVMGQIDKAPAGDHGFHIHEFGVCGDSGKAAGGHYNPTHAPHGHITDGGLTKAHAGDLGNMTIAADGTGKIDAIIPQITVTGGPMAIAGRAVILHEKADDFGQPVGNAGGRIGCGVITITAN